MLEGFTENDFKILKGIIEKNDKSKGLSVSNGTTVAELIIKTNLSAKKIRDTVKKCIELGYVSEGFAKVRTKTYILTQEGILFLKNSKRNIFGEEIKNE